MPENPYYIPDPGLGPSMFGGFNQGMALRQQMKKLAMDQAMESEKLKSAKFGNDTSLGITDANLGLPSAGLPQANGMQGPTAPKPLPNAVALPWMEKRMLAEEGNKNRQLQRDLAGQSKTMGYANQYRDEFNKNSEVFRKVVPMYKNIVAAASNPNPSAASDMSLIFAYMKLLDPGSTVREGEYATAANAGSAWQKAGNIYNKILSGEKLQPEQRSAFAREAQGVYKNNANMFGQDISRYTDLAKRSGIRPEDVVYDYGAGLGNESFEVGGVDRMAEIDAILKGAK